jgi:catechol 2,3-dioxygenase-like lactoylglutathione lyase family enzyme
MLHHPSLPGRDLHASGLLYDAALAELGFTRVCEGTDFAGYGLEPDKDKLALKYDPGATNAGSRLHLALSAPSLDAVNAFHAAAIRHGASDEGAPGWGPPYGPAYYAAFIRDLDGHRIEAVHKSPAADAPGDLAG